MLWFVLSLLSGLSQSTRDLLSKRSLQDLDEYTVVFSRSIFSTFCLLPVFLIIRIPHLDFVFWFAVLSSAGIFAVAAVLYITAIKLSPLSLVVPLLSFTPLFLLMTSPLMLAEYPSFLGLIGILFIVCGTYFLSFKDAGRGYLAPFRALVKEKGALVMLFVAFLFCIGSITNKLGAIHSDPFFFVVVNHIFISVFLFPLALMKSTSIRKMRVRLRDLTMAGLLNASESIFTQSAFSLTIVTYVLSAKRINILSSILYGHIFFKEERIIERLIGGVIMVFGVLLITLF